MRLFRVARPAGPAMNLAKTLVQLVVVWGFALGLLPWLAVQAEDAVGVPRWDWPGRHAAGAAVFLLGSSLGVASAWVMATVGQGTPVPFDAARELVVAGPYRFVRNPMAVSAVVQMLGVALAYGSGATVGLAVGGGVLWNVAIRPGEERFLADRFGQSYETYRAAVRCWVPRL
jgi:protein-S-isoprenylcysteine O-methyltransferase Ste14